MTLEVVRVVGVKCCKCGRVISELPIDFGLKVTCPPVGPYKQWYCYECGKLIIERHIKNTKVYFERLIGKMDYSTEMRLDDDGDRILYILKETDAQMAAKKQIGRELTDEELRRVQKGLESGLECWTIVMEAAVSDVVEEEAPIV